MLTECIHADLNIPVDEIKGLGVTINKVDVFGPTAQRLNSQGPGSGKEIKNRGAKNLIGNDVEDCLPGAVGCGPNAVFPSWRRKKFSAFAFTANNPQLFMPS